MFDNANHNDTTLWEVEAELDLPDDEYGQIVSRVFTAATARTAAGWVTDTFLTQWPNDVKIIGWRLAVYAPYDVDTRTGSGSFILYDTHDGVVTLKQAVEHYDGDLAQSLDNEERYF